MTDYFTQYVVAFELPTAAHTNFWKTAAQDLGFFEELPTDPWEVKRFNEVYGEDLVEDLDTNGSINVEFEFPPVVRKKPRTVLLKDAGGAGNPGAVGMLIRRYLQQFQIDKPVMFTYAATCSDSALDGFGGGWVHVTRESVTVHDAYSQMHEALDPSLCANKSGS